VYKIFRRQIRLSRRNKNNRKTKNRKIINNTGDNNMVVAGISNTMRKQNKQPSFTELPAYKKLLDHYHKIKDLHLRRLFSIDPHRFNTFSLSVTVILI